MSITLLQLDLQPELKFQAGFSLPLQQERAYLAARMMLCVQVLEALARHMSIYLRG
jgi:hypothetical protein